MLRIGVVIISLLAVCRSELVCPEIAPDLSGVCWEACSGDTECAEGSLCCSNGCGHACSPGVQKCRMHPEDLVTSEIPVGHLQSGQCPPGTSAGFHPDGMCCHVIPSFSDQPTCRDPRVPFLPNVGCGRAQGPCPTGTYCSTAAADGWAVCCPEEVNQCHLVDCHPDQPNCVMKIPEDCIPTVANPCVEQAVCEASEEPPVPHYCQNVHCGPAEECKLVQLQTQCHCPSILGIQCDCAPTRLIYRGRCVPRHPACPLVPTCAIGCEYGMSVDAHGCHQCGCDPDMEVCRLHPCLPGTRCAVEKHPNGNTAAVCLEDVLPEEVCLNHHCPLGSKCEAHDVQCEMAPCPPIPRCVPDDRCGPVCEIGCQWGLKPGPDGCPLCECNDRPLPGCENVRCRNHEEVCRIVDETLCVDCIQGSTDPSCGCHSNQRPRCVAANPTSCSSTDECDLDCPLGKVVDWGGCPLCTCVDSTPHYCRNKQCDEGKVCKWAHTGIACGPCFPGAECPPCPNQAAMCVPEVPTANCDTLTGCRIHCPHGRGVDPRGCPRCICNPAPECAPCHPGCLDSGRTSLDGCPICECDPENTCEDIQCGTGEVCEMQETIPQCNCPPDADCPCPLLPTIQAPVCVPRHRCPGQCRIYCEHGMKMGPDGCFLCECNLPPIECQALRCSENLVCKMTEATACPLCTREPCACRTSLEPTCVARYPRDCPVSPLCAHRCEFGHAVDYMGCRTCTCNPPPRPPCSPRHCPANCPFGFAVGPEGCETCRCKHPCDDFECHGRGECTIVSPLGECATDDFACFSQIGPMCVSTNSTCSACVSHDCPNGVVSDVYGCGLCTCNPYPGPGHIECPMVDCVENCRFGMMRDENGCPGCDCNPPTFPADVCGSELGPLVGSDGDYLRCEECSSGSTCVRTSHRPRGGYDVCCPSIGNDPEENGLTLDIIRLIMTFPVNFDTIRSSIDNFKGSVVRRIVREGIRQSQIKLLQVREGSVIVDMEIKVRDDDNQQTLIDLKDLADNGQLRVNHNNQDLTASRVQLQFSYTNEKESGINRTLIIIVAAVVAALLVGFLVIALVCFLKKKSKVQDTENGKSYNDQTEKGKTYERPVSPDEKRSSPPPSYTQSTAYSKRYDI